MIVPMKRAALIMQSKDAEAALRKLGSLGMMHIENQKPPVGKDISSLEEDLALASRALGVLSIKEYRGRSGLKDAKELKDWKFTAKHICDMYQRLDQLEEYSRGLTNKIVEWEAWGEFDPERIRSLEDKGIFVKLFQIPVKKLKTLDMDGVAIKTISEKSGTANIAVISRKKVDVPLGEVALPKMGLKEMRDRLSENIEITEIIKDNIRKYGFYRPRLVLIKEAFERELNFHYALKGMDSIGEISCVAGYIPHDRCDELIETAKQERWGVAITDPREDDNVPTLIRNPKWVAIINPVFKLLEVVPGYRELDISLWFLIFFSIFFGMLIGDAGIGAIFFALTAIAQWKFRKKVKDRAIFILFYVLSACAITWGVLSGTYFGQEWLGKAFRPVMPGLRDDTVVQEICFFLGALHLSIAHTWRFILKWPSLSALADLGWMMILWGAFFLARLLILSYEFPHFAGWLFAAGSILAICFASPNKNILKAVGSGFGNFLLNIVNNFTDVVSYIRLFAVGLATVAIADAFNNMAMSIGFNGVLASILTASILVIGHGLNVLLGPLSVLVHGVRLNVLEFCTHADIKWSGFSYKPLSGK